MCFICLHCSWCCAVWRPQNVSPYINHSAVYISFLSFQISEHILRNQNLIIGLDTYSRQRFIYLDPILIYISFLFHCLFEIHKIASCFPWLSLQSHYRVTDQAFLAETLKHGPSTFIQMCSLLLKERTFVFLYSAALFRLAWWS